MSANVRVDGVMVLTGAAIIAALGVTYLVKKKGAAVVDAVGNVVTKGLNPASTENYAYKGVNTLGSIATGDKDWTLGTATYNATHKDDGTVDYFGALTVGALSPFAGGLFGIGEISNLKDIDYSYLNKVNPASTDNVVYGGVNSVGSAVTGDKDFTLGGYIYDLFNPPKPDYTDIINDGIDSGDWN